MVNILFETEFEHLVSLIQDDSLQVSEVDVASVDVIEDSPCGAYKDVNTVPKLSDLVFNVDTSVHSDDSKLILIVLELLDFCRYLKSEFPRWSHNDGLKPSFQQLVPPHELNHWKSEGNGLA